MSRRKVTNKNRIRRELFRVTYVDVHGRSRERLLIEKVATEYFGILSANKLCVFACIYNTETGELLTWPPQDGIVSIETRYSIPGPILVTDDAQ